MMSVAFKKKTEMLCAAVAADVQVECEKLATERLFCTMFSRHADKFKGMIGEQEQKERCSRTDIMETVADAAKDSRSGRIWQPTRAVQPRCELREVNTTQLACQLS